MDTLTAAFKRPGREATREVAPVDFDDPSNPRRHGGSFVTGMINELINAFQLPSKVYKGEVDPMSDEGIGKSFDAAGALAGLGAGKAAVTKPTPGEVEFGVFAGPGAKTADLSALKAAIDMEAAKAPREDIIDATGWFKGPDGKWRFEISDDKAHLVDLYGKEANSIPKGDEGALQLILNHPELFKAYPDMLHTDVVANLPRGNGASTAPNAMHLSGKVRIPEEMGSGNMSQLSVLLHELQHQIQAREGFTPGMSPAMRKDELATLSMTGEANPDLVRSFNMLPQDKRKQVLFNLYRRDAGEVEAEMVQGRQAMTPLERAQFHPWDDLPVGIKEEDIIVPREWKRR